MLVNPELPPPWTNQLTGPVGENISSWANRVPGASAAAYPGSGSCANPGKGVPPVLSKAGAVFEKPGYLCASLPAVGPKTFVAAFTASGPQSTDWGCLLCGRGAAGQDVNVSSVKFTPSYLFRGWQLTAGPDRQCRTISDVTDCSFVYAGLSVRVGLLAGDRRALTASQ